MVIVTGAAGFIGSCLAKHLRDTTNAGIILVDDFSRSDKASNLDAISDCLKIDRADFLEWLEVAENIEVIYHIGARTDTTETDASIFNELNLEFTKHIWKYCSDQNITMIYASSAATYGNGELGYSDTHDIVNSLHPLNEYGISKNEFDKWALAQSDTPRHWYGLKFFNVYGPNEFHKGRMASVIFHAYHQIRETGQMKLFRSHNPDYKDGEQIRDFIYVKDLISVISFLESTKPESGLYNLGTGEARTFNDLASSVFHSLDKPADIVYVDTPADIRDKYQYFTEADMTKLIEAGYKEPFTSLEKGVEDYVLNYLVPVRNF